MLDLKELEASLDKSLANETSDSAMQWFKERDDERLGIISGDDTERFLERMENPVYASKEELERIAKNAKRMNNITVKKHLLHKIRIAGV